MKKLILILLPVMVAGMPVKAQDETARLMEIMTKIQVFYLPEPDQPSLSFKQIALKKLSDLGSGVIFGATDNNGMNTASMLLMALTQPSMAGGTASATKLTKPDLRFQETVYHALKLVDKPVKIFFVRDLDGLEESYLKRYNVYYKRDVNNLGYIWPGVFTDVPPFAGNIMLGEKAFEYTNLEVAKRMLISMIVQIGLKDFGPAKAPWFIDFPSPDMGMVKMIQPVSDTRRIENQAIANAFLLHFSANMRQQTFQWVKNFLHFSLPVSEAELGMFTTDDGQPVSLQRYSLRDRLLKLNAANTGKPLTDIPVLKQFGKNWVYYNSLQLKGKRYQEDNAVFYQDDLYLGLLYYQLARTFGLERFVEAIRYENSKLLTVKPGQKTLYLFQSMSLLQMKGKTAATLVTSPESREAREAVYPLAVLAFFGGGGYEKTLSLEQFRANLIEVSGAFDLPLRGEFPALMDLFLTKWKSKLSAVLTTDGPPENDHDYVITKGARIARVLGLD